MVNPFRAVANEVGGMFSSANSNDSARSIALLASVVVTPIVAPVAFLAAFFQKGKP